MIISMSVALPIGLLIVAVGAILFFTTRYKQLAKVLIAIGALISLATLALILLVVNSNM